MLTYEGVCLTCKEPFSRRITPNRAKNNPPKYCCNKCRFVGHTKDDSEKYVELTCKHCGIKFTQYVCKSTKKLHVYCSANCVAQDKRICVDCVFVCKYCGKEFTKFTNPAKRAYCFCSKECRTTYGSESGEFGFCNYNKLFERWKTKYGKEVVLEKLEAYKSKRSEIVAGENNPRFGAVLSQETKSKIAASCTGVANALKGKTFVEFYGEERGKLLGKQHSEKLREGFKDGRLSCTGSCCHKRNYLKYIYNDVKIKSSYELAFIFLFESEGLEFCKDFFYEPVEHRVQYELDDGFHTYSPDFYCVNNNTVYEVKPNNMLFEEKTVVKLSTATTYFSTKGIEFRVFTETELGKFIKEAISYIKKNDC